MRLVTDEIYCAVIGRIIFDPYLRSVFLPLDTGSCYENMSAADMLERDAYMQVKCTLFNIDIFVLHEKSTRK